MKTALIGCTGFVGSTLARSVFFNDGYHSTDINNIEGKSYDLIICAGAPAKKWLANQKPEEDASIIDSLIEHLKQVQAQTFVLISTVDVFRSPVGVDETSLVAMEDLHPYGVNRRRLEIFISRQFWHSLIVRLPGLVGPGLRKNIIFDFLNNNNIDRIDSRHVFQFYPMIHLWKDIQIALKNNLSLVHLTAEPVTVQDVAHSAFGLDFQQRIDGTVPLKYDMRTVYGQVWGKESRYQYDRTESIAAIHDYATTEPRSF